MPKTLTIVNSVYHLLTAVNLRRLSPAGEGADLLVTDATPGLPELIPRLRETGLFSRVLPVRAGELAQHYPMNREEAVAQCFSQGEALLRWALGEALEPAYSQVYFPNFDWLARLLACRYQCPFLWLEDGFSSYVIDFARPDRAAVNRHPQGARLGEQVQAALLYEPALAMRGDSLPNRPLPKLSPGDGELLALLNFIFQYRRPPWLPPFLFLEQSFRAEGIPGNDLELMRLCQQADRCCLVTVCSNGALSGRLCLGLDGNTVLLYKLYTGKVLWKENHTLARFLEAYRRQFAGGNTYVPQTSYQAASILKFLGGQYGG